MELAIVIPTMTGILISALIIIYSMRLLDLFRGGLIYRPFVPLFNATLFFFMGEFFNLMVAVRMLPAEIFGSYAAFHKAMGLILLFYGFYRLANFWRTLRAPMSVKSPAIRGAPFARQAPALRASSQQGGMRG
jgi:hypothetical protein